ncbi:MAG: enoyl-CoA hydratase/isomerase family protein [Actinomycetota bacterium]
MPTMIGDVALSVDEDFVATVEIRRPPNNFFDLALIDALAEACERVDADPDARAIVLCAEGKHFCAGADFGGSASAGPPPTNPDGTPRHLYDAALRFVSTSTPIVAAVHGAAIGGGLGVACAADFRIAAPASRFSANFARLGFHHGFGLTVTLPRIVGHQRALELLYTGRRMSGDVAADIGLADRLVPLDRVRPTAHELAAEIAASAPLAVRSIRETMRAGIVDGFRAATDRESAEQDRLRATDDWREGVAAMTERRPPRFTGS